MNLLAQTPEFLAIGENAVLPDNTDINFTVGNTGEIPVGWLEASVINVGEIDVIVNGVPLIPGAAKSYTFIGKGREAIPFIIGTEGRLLVMYAI